MGQAGPFDHGASATIQSSVDTTIGWSTPDRRFVLVNEKGQWIHGQNYWWGLYLVWCSVTSAFFRRVNDTQGIFLGEHLAVSDYADHEE